MQLANAVYVAERAQISLRSFDTKLLSLIAPFDHGEPRVPSDAHSTQSPDRAVQFMLRCCSPTGYPRCAEPSTSVVMLTGFTGSVHTQPNRGIRYANSCE